MITLPVDNGSSTKGKELFVGEDAGTSYSEPQSNSFDSVAWSP